jgi:hypothetical protein
MGNGLERNRTRDTMAGFRRDIMAHTRVSDKGTHKDGRINIELPLGTCAMSPVGGT